MLIADRVPCVAALERLFPTALPDGVEVWKLEFDLRPRPLDALLVLLPPAEQERCLRYRRHADRVRFAASRAVLRQLLAAQLGGPAELIDISIDERGKPQLRGGGTLFFNLSHAESFALIALSHGRAVGVDIESAPELCVETVLTPAELRYCETSADAQAFCRIWCGKEASLKALGLGIADHLLAVSAVPTASGRYELSLPQGMPSLQLWSLPAPAGFVAALAVSDAVAAVFRLDAEMAAECG